MTAATLTSDLAGAVCVLTMLEVNREMGHERG